VNDSTLSAFRKLRQPRTCLSEAEGPAGKLREVVLMQGGRGHRSAPRAQTNPSNAAIEEMERRHEEVMKTMGGGSGM